MDIKQRILARADLAPLVAARDLDGLAAALNESPPLEQQECWVDALGILNRCPTGKSILRKLKAGADIDAIIEVAWTSLVGGKGLDFGAPSTQQSIDEMTPALRFTDEEVAEMRALPMRPVLVTRLDIEAAIYNPDGSEK